MPDLMIRETDYIQQRKKVCQYNLNTPSLFCTRGTWRIRTAVPGFADQCLAARPRYLVFLFAVAKVNNLFYSASFFCIKSAFTLVFLWGDWSHTVGLFYKGYIFKFAWRSARCTVCWSRRVDSHMPCFPHTSNDICGTS